jgi:hypothetical protein
MITSKRVFDPKKKHRWLACYPGIRISGNDPSAVDPPGAWHDSRRAEKKGGSKTSHPF